MTPPRGPLIYKTKLVPGANRNFEIFDPLDFLAAVTSHIPNRGEHLVRYYGYYSSVQRGRRRRQGREKMPLGPVLLSDDAPHTKAARASWARFIKKVFAADPLVCAECGGAMIRSAPVAHPGGGFALPLISTPRADPSR